MSKIYEMLSRQCAELNFKNGKVKYFSILTQWDEADTIEEAINNIIEADEKYKGKSPLRYMIEENVNEAYSKNINPLIKMPMPKDLEISLDALRQSFEEWYKNEGWADALKDIRNDNI